MNGPLDHFERPIRIGDYILFALAGGGGTFLKAGRVVDIRQSGAFGYPFTILARVINDAYGKFELQKITTLHQTDTIMVIPCELLPLKYQELLRPEK